MWNSLGTFGWISGIPLLNISNLSFWNEKPFFCTLSSYDVHSMLLKRIFGILLLNISNLPFWNDKPFFCTLSFWHFTRCFWGVSTEFLFEYQWFIILYTWNRFSVICQMWDSLILLVESPELLCWISVFLSFYI